MRILIAALLVSSIARADPPPAPVAPGQLTTTINGWSAGLYGFVELDGIQSATQSFNEGAGNGLIARPGTWSGSHGRLMAALRNSRLGLRLGAPEVSGIR